MVGLWLTTTFRSLPSALSSTCTVAFRWLRYVDDFLLLLDLWCLRHFHKAIVEKTLSDRRKHGSARFLIYRRLAESSNGVVFAAPPTSSSLLFRSRSLFILLGDLQFPSTNF
ncbi:hypothetical protein SDJN02_22848, partial [Cucurbita argyrosperma subsp. argyrosperma]